MLVHRRLPLAVVDDVSGTPVTYSVHADHLNRPVRMTDATKASVWDAVWTPWGAAQSITGTASLDARFPGQWYQLEAGLHYNWHRHYDPTLGRYTQPDPLGFVDGPSVYGYVGADPLSSADPFGFMDHHYYPRANWKQSQLPPETKAVFRKATKDVGPHGWTKNHFEYNKLTKSMFDKFCKENNIKISKMTPSQAREFITRIANSKNSIIRNMLYPNINKNISRGSRGGGGNGAINMRGPSRYLPSLPRKY